MDTDIIIFFHCSSPPTTIALKLQKEWGRMNEAEKIYAGTVLYTSPVHRAKKMMSEGIINQFHDKS